MTTKRIKINRKFKVFVMLGWIIIWLFTPSFISAANYSVSLQKGSMRYRIDSYDEEIWNATVSEEFGPEEYFGENANITGSESKSIFRGWYDVTYNTSELFFSLLVPPDRIPTLIGLGINQTIVDENYTTTYEINLILTAKWSFHPENLPESATYPNSVSYILKDPQGFKTLLDDYNSFTEEVNNYTAPLKILSNYTANNFLFELFRTRFAVASPIDSYLTEMVNTLNNVNVSSEANTLILDIQGEDNYSVQINFEKTGLQSTITFLDSDENVFYKITPYGTEWAVWLTVSIVGAVIIAVVVYAFYKNWKRKKEFRASLARVQS